MDMRTSVLNVLRVSDWAQKVKMPEDALHATMNIVLTAMRALADAIDAE